MDIYNHKHLNWFAKRRSYMMYKYEINLKLQFKTRPTKHEVESKLFDVLKNGFILKSTEDKDYFVKKKTIKEKNIEGKVK